MRKHTAGKKPVKRNPRAEITDLNIPRPGELYTSPSLLMQYRAAARKAGLIFAYRQTEFCGLDSDVWSETWVDDVPPAFARVGIIRAGEEDNVTWGIACRQGHLQFCDTGLIEPTPEWTRYACTKLAEQAELNALEKACPEACLEVREAA